MEMHELVKLFQMKCSKITKDMIASDHNLSIEEGLISHHHEEGSVWTHTMMVCLMAEQLKYGKIIDLASILHDVGKPMARAVIAETNRVRFIGHEGLSSFIALDCLKDMGLSLDKKDLSMLMNLISHHTELYHLIESEDYAKKALEKFKGNKELLENLIKLSKCDALGRFAVDKEKVLDLEAKLLPLLHQIEENKDYTDYKNTITVLVGPSGSGKSTWIKNNAKSNEVVLCRDDLVIKMGGKETYADSWHSVDQDLVDKEFNLLIAKAFKEKKNIIVDRTHMSAKARRSVLGQANKSYKKKAVVFYSSYNEILKRNQIRYEETNKFISLEAIKQQMMAFSSPLFHEFHEIEEIFSL